MIIKSPQRKTNITWDVKLTNNDGSNCGLEKRTYIKYLGVLIDDTLSWKHQVSYLCTRISRNTGIISKLRHCISLSQLKQLYYNLTYPYISYAITSWGSAFATQIKNIQTKQNHVIRLMFFTTLHGPDTDSPLPLPLLINYSFLSSLISGILKNYQISLASIFAMQVKSTRIIRDMLQNITFTNHVSGLT